MAAMFYYAICILLVYLSGLAKSDETENPETTAIRAYLDGLNAAEYNPHILPEGSNGYGSPVEVKATMYILDIQKVDDFSMDYAVQMYFRQYWNDSRLKYEDLDLSSIELKNTEKIWSPDLFFVEEKTGRKHNIVVPNQFVKISPSGEVRMSTRLTMIFSCPMDLRKFPHDTQKCTFNIESYGYERSKIQLEWERRKHDPVMVTQEVTMLGFRFVSAKPSMQNLKLTFGEYSRLQVTLTFQRETGFFFTRLYAPFIILTLLAWLSFWVGPKLGHLRIILLLVILYLMVNIGSEINTYVPPVSYTKGSDVWIAFCESLVFAAFLELMAVSMLWMQEKKDKKKKCGAELPIVADDAKVLEMNTESMTSSANIVALRLRNGKLSNRIDHLCKLVYPAIFLLFNIIYWLVHCTG